MRKFINNQLSEKKIFVCVILLSCNISVNAQLDKIDTDRPDQTESAVLTPKKWLQFEMGLGRQQNTSAEHEFLIPTLLSKYGISKRIELRLVTSLKQFPYQTINGSSYATGLEPIEIGTKIAITEENKWLPETSVLFHLAIPRLASKKLQANTLAPVFKMLMQHNISNFFDIGYNLGVEWDGLSNKAAWLYTLSPGFNLSEKWYGYIEVYGWATKDETPKHNIDGGFAYYINKNSKIDLSSGFGISEESPDWYIAAGVSVRFKSSR